METLPEGAILVLLDVVGLYPHIPHAEGLEAIRHALNEIENQEMPTSLIVHLAELVLKNNNFEFDGKQYLQTWGTTIATKMAPLSSWRAGADLGGGCRGCEPLPEMTCLLLIIRY